MTQNHKVEGDEDSSHKSKDLDRLEKLFGLYRDYIKVEHDLQNHRSTWHLLMQGFLFATLGVIGEWQIGEKLPVKLQTEQEWLPYVLMGAGALIAVLTWISIQAATTALETIVEKWREQSVLEFDPEILKRIPDISGGGNERAAEWGQVAPRFIPIIALLAWGGVWLMYHNDQKNGAKNTDGTSTTANSEPAFQTRFIVVSTPTHSDTALDTISGTLCKTWDWQPKRPTDKSPIYAIKTCDQLYRESLKAKQSTTQ